MELRTAGSQNPWLCQGFTGNDDDLAAIAERERNRDAMHEWHPVLSQKIEGIEKVLAEFERFMTDYVLALKATDEPLAGLQYHTEGELTLWFCDRMAEVSQRVWEQQDKE